MKDELGGQIMKKLVGLRPKTYSYLKDSNYKGKKTKDTKICAAKKLKYQDYNNYLKVSQILNKVNYLEKKGINVDILKEDKK